MVNSNDKQDNNNTSDEDNSDFDSFSEFSDSDSDWLPEDILNESEPEPNPKPQSPPPPDLTENQFIRCTKCDTFLTTPVQTPEGEGSLQDIVSRHRLESDRCPKNTNGVTSKHTENKYAGQSLNDLGVISLEFPFAVISLEKLKVEPFKLNGFKPQLETGGETVALATNVEVEVPTDDDPMFQKIPQHLVHHELDRERERKRRNGQQLSLDSVFLHYCYHCTARFNCPQQLNEHLEKIHTPGKIIYTCPICYRDFVESHRLFRHLESHVKAEKLEKKWNLWERDPWPTKEEMGAKYLQLFPCKFCLVRHPHRPRFLEHMRTQHPEASRDFRRFPCLKCPEQIFSTIRELVEHMNIEHKGDARKLRPCRKSWSETCPLCKRTVQRLHKFRHWSYHCSAEAQAENEKSLPLKARPRARCKFCLVKFKHRSNYNDHMKKLHSGQKGKIELTCSECTASSSPSDIFLSIRSLYDHMISEHKYKYFVPPTQAKIIPTEAVTINNDTRRQNNFYKCRVCAEIIPLEQCANHRKNHQREPQPGEDGFPFHCPICHSGIRDRYAMKKHLIVHLQNNPFKCPFLEINGCLEKFSNAIFVKRHVQNKHLGGKFDKKYLTKPAQLPGKIGARVIELERVEIVETPDANDPVRIKRERLSPARDIMTMEVDDNLQKPVVAVNRVNSKTDFDYETWANEINDLNIHLMTDLILNDPVYHSLIEAKPHAAELIFGNKKMNRRREKKFECGHCLKTFFYYYALDKHKIHCKNNPDVDIDKTLEEETKTEKTKKSKPAPTPSEMKLLCDQCGYRSDSMKDLKEHKRKAKNHGPHQCPYQQRQQPSKCSHRFQTKEALNQHIQRIHKAERKFVCGYDHCSARFTTRSRLHHHEVKVHDPEKRVLYRVKKIKCEICGELLCGNQSVTQHVLKVHYKLKWKMGKQKEKLGRGWKQVYVKKK